MGIGDALDCVTEGTGDFFMTALRLSVNAT